MSKNVKLRTESQMMNLILEVAKSNENIRAVYMNGSRTNPNAPKDIYQDYDIVYIVTQTETFLTDKNWISVFGELAMLQEPDSNDLGWGENHDFSRSYGWLMLFKDGNRIDLHIEIKETALEEYAKDSLTIPLLDKDNILPRILEANDSIYHIKKPSKEQYLGCCNEFWWCLNNAAKGIARDELSYCMEMYNHYIREMLIRMLEWQIGTDTDFSISAGKMGKYFKKYLSPNLYEMYKKTYSDSDYNNLWMAIFTSCELFRTVAKTVAERLGYTYNISDDANMTEYLNNVKDCKIG